MARGYRRSGFMRAGCGPGDCTGLCDKSMLAIGVEGHVGRFACAPFGNKVSNTWLAILTDAVVEWVARWLEINSGAYVDDFLNALDVHLHEICKGLEGGCPTCCAAAEAGQPKF